MSSQPKIPIVDFTKEGLKSSSTCRLSACKNVRKALEEYGCFVAVYDKVSWELSNEVFMSLQELFDLPIESKAQNISDIPYYGYLGQVPSMPHFQSLGIENTSSMEAIQSFTNLMWPSGNHHFCETMQSYTKQISELEKMVMRMVFESYGLEKYYESHVAESLTYLLRVMKYGVPKMEETNVGVKAHTDNGFITILHQNQVNGLEVKTKGGQWIAVDFSPSSFVVMAGEALLAWSNGRIHSALHRVIMSGSKARYSLGQFSYKKGITHVHEELVDDEHPLQFKPFDNFGLLRFALTKEGQQIKNMAKNYCGI